MERFVTVNDFPGSMAESGPFEADSAENPEPGIEDAGPDSAWRPAGSGLGSLETPNYGPCLYLGPHGQRCGNQALSGGFCARHQPDELGRAKSASRGVSRVIAAGVGILAAIWPVLADLLREVLRWIHSH